MAMEGPDVFVTIEEDSSILMERTTCCLSLWPSDAPSRTGRFAIGHAGAKRRRWRGALVCDFACCCDSTTAQARLRTVVLHSPSGGKFVCVSTVSAAAVQYNTV